MYGAFTHRWFTVASQGSNEPANASVSNRGRSDVGMFEELESCRSSPIMVCWGRQPPLSTPPRQAGSSSKSKWVKISSIILVSCSYSGKVAEVFRMAAMRAQISISSRAKTGKPRGIPMSFGPPVSPCSSPRLASRRLGHSVQVILAAHAGVHFHGREDPFHELFLGV